KYYTHSPKKNPKGPDKGLRKVVRGGSWYNDIWYLQAGMRFRLAPDVKLNSLGFRCVKNP
ncbi:MAG: SUMF1/EgtB/PvdO family nonheme iron enzyme, partial [Nitrospinae bacterium]|nr:SUMF1/EgtB/PvdO family nonheme iron enzyme [Nitrospinota bacterium]